jgi:hypothetical protein
MKRLIAATSVACCLLGLASSPAAVADHCGGDYPDVCHEFDWAQPYYRAFDRHGIGYLAGREGIPLLVETDGLCTGRYTTADVFTDFPALTIDEMLKIMRAAHDVCPTVMR